MYHAISYLLAGAIATAIHASVALLSIRLGANQSLANGVAFLAANIVAHQINARITFGTRPDWANYRRYLAVSMVGFLYSLAIGAAGDFMHRSPWQAITFIAITLPLFTYTIHRAYTFKPPRPPLEDSGG
jgi:putative flippase GtrA